MRPFWMRGIEFSIPVANMKAEMARPPLTGSSATTAEADARFSLDYSAASSMEDASFRQRDNSARLSAPFCTFRTHALSP